MGKPNSGPWKVDVIEHSKMKAHIALVFYRDVVTRKVFFLSDKLRQRFMRKSMELSAIKPYKIEDVYIQSRLDLNELLENGSARKSTQPARTAEPAARAVSASKTSQVKPSVSKEKKLEPLVYNGILKAAGHRERDTGSKRYQQFGIDIEDCSNGQKVTRLWGVDLKRALEDAEVQVGDEIILTDYGPIKVWSAKEQKTSFRKEYSIEQKR